jgi:hypothetical protein
MALIKLNSDQISLTGKDTDNLSEGSSNLYYTNARARSAISEDSTQLSYNNSTGVLSYTQGDTDTVAEGSSNLYYTDARVRTNQLDQLAAPSSAVAMNDQKITGLATPTADADATTKAYVDGVAAGLFWKDAARVLMTSNVNLGGPGGTLDSQTMVANDRVLLTNQTTDGENGIYVWNGAAAAMTRATDADAFAELDHAAVFIKDGTYADTGWTQTATLSAFTGQVWTQFTGTGQITAGDGLAKSGNTLSVNVDDSSIEINSDSLRVKSSGITNAMLAGSITNAKLSNSTISGVALGANLNSLSKATNGGVSFSSYNGSAAVGDLTLDFDDLSDAVINVASDSIAFVDSDDDGTKRDTIADLVTAMAGDGLGATSGVLAVGVDGSSIETSGDALRVKASGVTNAMLAGSIANAKLANSTISGVSLGSNLASLSASATGGIVMSSYNGSAAVSNITLDINSLSAAAVNVAADSIAIYDADADETGKETVADLMTAVAGDGLSATSGVLAVGVDDSSIETNGDALRVKASGITNAMLAGSITLAKFSAKGEQQGYTGNNSTTEFSLGGYVPTAQHGTVQVYLNGMRCQKVDSLTSPAVATEYLVTDVGGTSTKVTMGVAPPTGDFVYVDFWM